MHEMTSSTNGKAHADESAIDNIFARAGMPSVEAGSRAVGAEIERQIATAKRYPRSFTGFMKRAKDMACASKSVAESCFYSLRRGGNKIEGPSIRLAEIVASAYGNLRISAHVVEVGDDYIAAEGSAIDLESNTGFTAEIRRRILDKDGRRYNIDMIGVTGQAACAIATRNAIFKVVPRALVDGLVEDCKAAARTGETLESLRTKVVDYWARKGVSVEEMCTFVDCFGLQDLGFDQVTELRGLATAIKEGHTTLEAERERIRQTHEDREHGGASDVPPPIVAAPTAAPKPSAEPNKPTGEQALFDDPPAESGPKGKRK